MDSSSEEDSVNSETRREWATQDDMSELECVYSTLISTLSPHTGSRGVEAVISRDRTS